MASNLSGETDAEGKRHPLIMIGIFIHAYRWGYQIRGDDRGYLEKVKAYGALGIKFFTLEREPSLQKGMGEDLYASMLLKNCTVPPKNLRELGILTLRSLRAAIHRYPSRPVSIYAYNQDIENLWPAFLLKILLGVPLMVIYHQIEPTKFTPFRNGIENRVQRGSHPVRVVLKSLLPALNRFAAKHADVQIALSEATKMEAEKYLEIMDCRVIGNGLDAIKFRPLILPKIYDAVFLGRLAPQKGIDVLLRAWSEVIKTHPALQLILLGGGVPDEVTMYKKMAQELRLEENVTFAGFVDDRDLVRILNSSKIFVFPSRKEGFAQAVSQAMGCGLACILSDIPPLREVYGRAAVFSPVDEPVALAENIIDLLGKADKIELLGRKARQLAESFSWQETARRELSELSKFAGRRRGSIASGLVHNSLDNHWYPVAD